MVFVVVFGFVVVFVILFLSPIKPRGVLYSFLLVSLCYLSVSLLSVCLFLACGVFHHPHIVFTTLRFVRSLSRSLSFYLSFCLTLSFSFSLSLLYASASPSQVLFTLLYSRFVWLLPTAAGDPWHHCRAMRCAPVWSFGCAHSSRSRVGRRTLGGQH